MEPPNLWKDDPWKDVPDDDGIGENFVKTLLRRLQQRTVLRDIISLFFGGFSSIVGGMMSGQHFAGNTDKNETDKSD